MNWWSRCAFWLAALAAVAADSHNGGKSFNVTDEQAESTVFRNFIAHSNNMTCSADEHARPFNNQIRGVNLGGWMVLEPWITPSLFMQFLGGGENTSGESARGLLHVRITPAS